MKDAKKNYVNINLKNDFDNVKEYIIKKSKSYKLEIEEEIGREKIKEFIEVSFFRKTIKIIKVVFIIIGIISGIMTVCSFFSQSDDSIAMVNYQKGMNYLEDKYYKDAEKCFEDAYEKNSDLLQLIYYYAYTEFMLGDFEKSYKILEENKNSLDDNEIVFLAMYEYKNNNYEKCKQYMNKIQEPENLDIFAFCQYVDYSVKLGFLNDYQEGLNIVCNNSILLDAKLNIASVLPNKEINFYEVNGFKVDEEYLRETINRIEYNSKTDKSKYVRSKLYMYLLFFYYSIQYDNIEVPIRYFADIAETLDYANNADITKQLLIVLYLYASELELYPEIPEEMKKAYKITSEKYHDLELLEKENSIEIEDEDEKLFKAIGKISKEMEEDCFNPKNYSFSFATEYKEDNLLKVWAKTIEYMVNYKGR